MTNDSLATRYAHTFADHIWTDERCHLVDQAHERIHRSETEAWQFVQDVLNHTSLEHAQYVGADLLEDFLVLHGKRLLKEVITRADKDDILFAALRVVRIPEAGEVVWRELNDYLRVRGVPEEQVLDWSGYLPSRTDDKGVF